DAKDYARLLDVGGEIVEMDVLREAGRAFFEQALDVWRTTPDWGGWTSALRQATGRKGRALFLPLRLALTGRTHGPEMRAVVAFLGKDGVACRLRDVLERLEQ
ncbi:MAG: glutamate--tRNA ligase, partial [Zetaproteobacteria bacterium]